MSTKKKIAVGLIVTAVVLALAAGLVWTMLHFFLVDFRLYDKQAESLDLRGQNISLSHYDKLRQRFPGCEIRWDIPFQGSTYPDDTTVITVTTLTAEDVANLDYFTQLKTVQAGACTDYDQLLALQARRPEVSVLYNVQLGSSVFGQNATVIRVDSISQEELGLLAYLPELTGVVVGGGEDMQNIPQLQAYCQEHGLDFGIAIGASEFPEDTRELTASNITDGELNLLDLLRELESVHLITPQAQPENLVALQESMTGAEVTWEQEICGKLVPLGLEEIDLSDAEIESLDQVKEAMPYFPGTQRVFLGECGIDNDEIAAFREEMREQYKVVWIVRCGEKLPTRTDTTSFMPSRDGVGYIRDDSTVNLRYCEDIIAVDVGHMGVKDVSFVEYMPNLKYLILAHTEVQDITPLSTCKNLIFLELDWSPVRDFSPLVGCTALEDLNIGNTGADVTPLEQMTWLKNLWMVFRAGSAWQLTQALPNTHVVASGNATVSSGWRRLPNYYAMRDALNMYYMEW